MFFIEFLFSKKTIKYFKNEAVSENFKETVVSYLFEEDDFINIQIYSFDNQLSPIKILCLQNMYGLANVNCEKYEEEYNKYRYSIEKTIYTGKNHIDIDKFNETYTEEEYYEAFRAADIIGNNKLLLDISKKYVLNRRTEFNELSEEIYSYLNACYIGEKADNSEICKKVYEIVKNKEKSEYVDIDIDELDDMLMGISIWDYEGDDGFAALLNMYTVALQKAGCMTEENKEIIQNYIKESENQYGYSINGVYDFMTSVYYSNILYVLDGEEDIGFR